MADETQKPEADDIDPSVDASTGNLEPGLSEAVTEVDAGVGVDSPEAVLQPEPESGPDDQVDEVPSADEAVVVEDDQPAPDHRKALEAVSLAQIGAATAALLNLPMAEPVPVEEGIKVQTDQGPIRAAAVELCRMPDGRAVMMNLVGLHGTNLSQVHEMVKLNVHAAVQAYNNRPKESAYLPKLIAADHYIKSCIEVAELLWRQENTVVLNTDATPAEVTKPAQEIDAAFVVDQICNRGDLELHASTIRVALQTGGSIPYALKAALRYFDKLAEQPGDPTPLTDLLAERLRI